MEYGGNTTCLEIILPNSKDLLVIDCGTGARNLGNELVNTKESLKGHIFITHPHWDHIQGFPFFKPFMLADNSFRVYMPPQDNLSCKEILQDHLSKTFFPITIDMFSAEIDYFTYHKRKINFNNFTVSYMYAKHTIPTAIYKFEINNKVIVFAPDNELPVLRSKEDEAFIQDFREFVSGADVLVHDGQYEKSQYYSHIGWGHSDWQTLLETTKDLKIKQLFITHHDPDSDDALLKYWDKLIKNEYGHYYEEVSLVKEGQEIIL